MREIRRSLLGLSLVLILMLFVVWLVHETSLALGYNLTPIGNIVI